jgi:hypothetical protein
MNDAARVAAEQAASGIKRNKLGAYMYLLQHDSTAVTERREGAGGDWLVAGLDDERVINLGDSPMLIVVGHQVRFVQTRQDPNTHRNVVVFNLPWETMNATQQQATELPWDNPNSARPVDSFTLVHVTDSGIDPHKIGKFNFQPKPGSAKAAGKWVSDLGATIRMKPVGVAPFAAIWGIGSVATINAKYNSRKLALTHKYLGALAANTGEWHAMQTLWNESVAEHSAEASRRSAAPAIAHDGPSDEELGERADREADEYKRSNDPNDYATSLPPEDEETKPVTGRVVDALQEVNSKLDEPALTKAQKDAGLSFDTRTYIRYAKTERKAIRLMTRDEHRVALAVANHEPVTNRGASLVAQLLEAWAKHMGWDSMTDDDAIPF